LTQTLALSPQTILAARVALLTTANEHADAALRYIEQGYPLAAAQAAECAHHYASAWRELAFAA
jgi:hypothetical protein